MDDDELLVQLIGSRARTKVHGRDLGSLLALPPNQLASTGLSPTSRSRILVAAEMARRHQPAAQIPHGISCPSDVVALCQEMRASKVEVLAVLSLDRSGRLLDKQVVAVGAVAHVAITPREVFISAIVARASAIVLVHNHPSGNVSPSAEDIAFTGRIAEAARLLGIDVLDHVIVGRRTFLSFKEGGLMNSYSVPWNVAKSSPGAQSRRGRLAANLYESPSPP
jgi:DNA repair protein RadC